ncbi:GAF domain-containing protein [Persicobacter diffluens]|uniref:GAF domain-containing protein n=1 Tax=Persicobacter diffluens TaxID=981 RepID=A0AAN5AK22_9BACT|nr:hypothetical protein PEDI_21360 [Persicobacter diffluens]
MSLKSILLSTLPKGLSEEEEFNYQLTNIISFFLTIVGLAFTLISAFVFPTGIIYPIIGTTFFASPLLLNKFKQIDISRLALIIGSVIALSLYHTALRKPGDELIVGLALLQLSFALVGFLLFTKKEKSLFAAANLIALGGFFYLVTASGKNINDMDISVFTTGFMHYIAVFAALIIAFFIMLTFRYINTQNQNKTLVLMKDVQKQQEEMSVKNDELNKYIGEIEIKQEEDKQRQWIAEGQSKVDHLLRTEEDKDAVFDKLLSFLVKYMGVNQGAVFLVENQENNDEYLKMAGCYAYDRKKYLDKRINIGEGLIGQCFLEKERIFLTEIPENYVNITSGLGSANPTNLIIIPFLYNEEVVAVIELASFDIIPEHQITFLENMGQSVAAFVMNHRVNIRTQKLLEESQMNAEMLRAQEEEMRQNMEELTATQEEAERRTLAFQKELAAKNEEIENLKLRLQQV